MCTIAEQSTAWRPATYFNGEMDLIGAQAMFVLYSTGQLCKHFQSAATSLSCQVGVVPTARTFAILGLGDSVLRLPFVWVQLGNNRQIISEIMAQVISIKMSKFDNQPWGFRLQGGVDFSAPLTVQKVLDFLFSVFLPIIHVYLLRQCVSRRRFFPLPIPCIVR